MKNSAVDSHFLVSGSSFCEIYTHNIQQNSLENTISRGASNRFGFPFSQAFYAVVTNDFLVSLSLRRFMQW